MMPALPPKPTPKVDRPDPVRRGRFANPLAVGGDHPAGGDAVNRTAALNTALATAAFMPAQICDQRVAFNNFYSARDYPEHMRRIRFRDPESRKSLVFLTNHRELPALTICALYKSRWQVELFFKWIKQHLRINRFYGTAENAVKI